MPKKIVEFLNTDGGTVYIGVNETVLFAGMKVVSTGGLPANL
nr:hypothetical protein [Treponema sp.]